MWGGTEERRETSVRLTSQFRFPSGGLGRVKDRVFLNPEALGAKRHSKEWVENRPT